MEWLGDLLARQWADLLARPSGPYAFRFFLQPTLAIIVAIRDGLKDAETGRSPYLRTVLADAEERGSRLREGLHATGRILLLGLVMDTAYQVVALQTFYPVEAVTISLVLAFVPYLLIRGPVARVASWWIHRAPPAAEP
jgi:hypothetical protein